MAKTSKKKSPKKAATILFGILKASLSGYPKQKKTDTKTEGKK